MTSEEQLIDNTTTDTDLSIQAELDQNSYQTGIAIFDQQMEWLNLSRAKFHDKDWNYIIRPKWKTGQLFIYAYLGARETTYHYWLSSSTDII